MMQLSQPRADALLRFDQTFLLCPLGCLLGFFLLQFSLIGIQMELAQDGF